MKHSRTFLKMCLVAYSASIISCSKTEMEDLSVIKTSNEYQHSLAIDDISIVGSDSQMGIYLSEIANQIREYKKDNPNANDKDVDVFANKIVHKTITKTESSKARAAYTNMDGYITGKLNAKEQTLYYSNKAKALLCMAIGKFALSYAESNYIQSVLHNGNGDAFRHTLWNFRMTIDVGNVFAKMWSDAHEYGSIGQPITEQTMDLYNNSIGIQLGKDNPTTVLHSTFISKTKEKVSGGKCKIMSSDMSITQLYWSTSFGQK